MGIPDIEKLEGVQEPFKSAILQMIMESGGRLYIKSGYRDHEHQKRLWADALRKYGDPEVADNWVARPGTSNHEHGWAVDLGFSGKDAIKWGHENAGRYGLMFPLANENWHIEWAGDRAGGQPGGGSQTGWRSGVMYNLNYEDPTAAQNPQEVLANRLHSMLSILGLDAASMGPGVSVQPVRDPSMDVLLNPDAQAAASLPQAIPEAGAHETLAPGVLGGVLEGPGGTTQSGGAFLPPGGGDINDPNGYGAFARQVAQRYGWSEDDVRAWIALGNEESGDGQSTYDKVLWNPNADNPTSTAYGIGQFLDSTWAGVGGTKTSDPWKQIEYMGKYIAQRYGNPRNALDFHHRNNWY